MDCIVLLCQVGGVGGSDGEQAPSVVTAEERETERTGVVGGDGVQSAMSEEVGGDGVQSAMSEEVGGDGVQSAMSEEVGGDGVQSAMSEVVGGDGVQSAMSEEVGGDGVQSAMCEEVGGGGVQSAMSEEVVQRVTESTEQDKKHTGLSEMAVVASEAPPPLPYTEPHWSGPPSSSYYLTVIKSGSVVGEINISNKPFQVTLYIYNVHACMYSVQCTCTCTLYMHVHVHC